MSTFTPANKRTLHPHPESTHNLSLLSANGQPFEIPVEGSLGLLALGYVGLMLWRDTRKNAVSNFTDSYLFSSDISSR